MNRYRHPLLYRKDMEKLDRLMTDLLKENNEVLAAYKNNDDFAFRYHIEAFDCINKEMCRIERKWDIIK